MDTIQIVADIINDLDIIDGEALLSGARLEHWAKVLQRDYRGPGHKNVYLQLGGFACELAEKGMLAAFQFEALATLPSCAFDLARAGTTEFSRTSTNRDRFSQLLGTTERRDTQKIATTGPLLKARSFLQPMVGGGRPRPRRGRSK